MKVIHKIDLINGKTYKGFCRNNFIATWDEKKQKFYYIKLEFNPIVDWIAHIDDVEDTNIDGFIPIEIIEPFEEIK